MVIPTMDFKDYYKILGVEPTADDKAIKAAYGEGLYECPVMVESDLDARKAVDDVKANGVNALVVYLGTRVLGQATIERASIPVEHAADDLEAAAVRARAEGDAAKAARTQAMRDVTPTDGNRS